MSHSDYMWVGCDCLGLVVFRLGCGVRVYGRGEVVDCAQGEGGLRRSIPDSGGVRWWGRIGERVFAVGGSGWSLGV